MAQGRVSQARIRTAIEAARHAGLAIQAVEIAKDGTIRLRTSASWEQDILSSSEASGENTCDAVFMAGGDP